MTDYKLPDADLELIHSARTHLDTAWRVIAARVNQRMADNPTLPRMAIQQAFAYASGKKLVTVRAWSRFERRFGEALDELPDGFAVGVDQLRYVEKEARQRKADPVAVLLERINESDKYGSQFIPPDTYAAQLNGHKPTLPPDLAALDRAARNIATAIRKNARLRDKGEDALAMVEALKRLAGKDK